MSKLDIWIEIKPSAPTELESKLAGELAVATQKDVFIMCNGIVVPELLNHDCFSCAEAHFADGGGDWAYAWCECPNCGKVGLQFDGRSDRLDCKECDRCFEKEEKCDECRAKRACPMMDGSKGYNFDSPRLKTAFAAALSARFEFGENG